jgi:hypothetical protein
MIAGGIIFKIKADHEKQLAAQQADKEKAIELEKSRRAEQEKKFEVMEAMLKKQIAEAKSDAERLAIQKQLDDAHRSHAASSGGKVPARREGQEGFDVHFRARACPHQDEEGRLRRPARRSEVVVRHSSPRPW